LDYGQIGIALLVVLFLLISLGMILVVLIQRPQGGGLSGAFGAGGGSGQSAFGARTGDALTISTIIVFVAFLGIAIALNFVLRPAETSTQPVAGPAGSEQTSQQPAPQPGSQPGSAPQGQTGNQTGAGQPAQNEPAQTNEADAPGFPEPDNDQPPAGGAAGEGGG